ncbi:MAG TPA: glycosyltransferase family 2 protein [Ferruginibacter sp.]|nr:glycosyltransferase family 2 protein [Ferruginibacter sp.]HMP21257.1 glycosyltransferase family 2 protein [Ferruginibacter sp.]
MQLPLVSVLIPSYNAAAYIAQTLESVLQQSWPNIEVIVVDDGSADDTVAIANRYSAANCRVIQQINVGACAARNRAFALSKGDYIQYLDADDVLHPDKIALQMEALGNLKDSRAMASGMWAHFARQIDEAVFPQQAVYKNYDMPVQLLADMWCRREMMQTSVWLTPRILIEQSSGWDERLSINQDGEFFCRMLLSASRVVFAPAKTYYRTGIANSVSRAGADIKKAESLLLSYKLYSRYTATWMHIEPLKKGLAHSLYQYIYTYYSVFPALTREAVQDVQQLNVPQSICPVGGRGFRLLCRIAGFYNALRLRQMFSGASNRVQ